MTIYIYSTEGFEEGNYNLIDQHDADTNQECEEWANDNYGDSDLFAHSYTEV